MSDPTEEAIERIARAFHEAYEALAPTFNYDTRKESAVPWEDVPPQNRALMRSTVAALFVQGYITTPKEQP